MGGTTEGADVLSLWLASRDRTAGGHPQASTHALHAAEPPAAVAAAAAATPRAAAAPRPVATVAETVASAPETVASAPETVASAPETVAVATRESPHPLAPTARTDMPARPDVDFAPRDGTQRLAGALLVAAAMGSGLAGWVAWDRASPTAAGVAAIGCLLAIGLWFLRAAAAPPRVRISGGQLEITAHGERHTWDLTNPYVPVRVVGEPGRRDWQVRLLRPGLPTYVIDGSVVEPREFMGFLRSYRPEL